MEQRRESNVVSASEGDDVYSDLYSAFSQVTSTTANDIDQLPYSFTLKTCLILVGATVGGLLFGYDTGVISGVLLTLRPQDISRSILTDFDKELITSMTGVGSFFGSMLGFPLADKYGRKMTLAYCCLVFIIAAIWMAISTTLLFLVMGRFVVGIAVGIAAQCIPVFMSEISPSKIRGTILTLNSLAITGGQLASYVMSLLFANVEHSWRYLFGLSAIPGLIFILLLDFIPESPRWLISIGNIPKAYESLKIIYPKATSQQLALKLKRLIVDLNKLRKYQNIDEPLFRRSSSSFFRYNSVSNSLQFSLEESGNERVTSDSSTPTAQNILGRHKRVYRMEPKARRALLVGCVLMFFQQITGFNAFMYYATIIFSDLDIKNPLVPAIAVAFTNFMFTFVALRLVDSIGRRITLLYTVSLMTLALLLSSFAFARDNTTLVIATILVFVASYASGMGAIPWTTVEFLPLNRRSFGSGCISCTNWLTNAVVSMSYLSVMNRFGNERTMLIFAFFSFLNWIFVYFKFPEVKGLTLEEIGRIFEDGIDVHYVYRNYH